MIKNKVFITGAGIVSAIGNNTSETFEALKAGRSGISKAKFLQSVHCNEIPLAEVPLSNEEILSFTDLPADGWYTRTTLLAAMAIKQILPDGNAPLLNCRLGLISGTTVGGMDKSENFYYDYLHRNNPNAYIKTHDCADHTEQLADIYGIRDFVTTTSTACSSSANSILLAARMIRCGQLDKVLAGGSECLTRFHLNGFNSLKILDKSPSRPFDASREGINLGEGAAYLMLESEASAASHPDDIICELQGWGNSCEAFHQTASSPDGTGALLAMKKALAVSGLIPDDIGYVNAHGTGTDNNDLSEGRAMESLFGARIPPLSSTKPFTGHTTSAAGSIEALITILAMINGMVWPNLNYSSKIPVLSFEPAAKLITDVDLKHVLTNSFGFGGNNTTLIFSKFNGF